MSHHQNIGAPESSLEVRINLFITNIKNLSIVVELDLQRYHRRHEEQAARSMVDIGIETFYMSLACRNPGGRDVHRRVQKSPS